MDRLVMRCISARLAGAGGGWDMEVAQNVTALQEEISATNWLPEPTSSTA